MARRAFQWSRDEQEPAEEKPSRSEKKRQALALQELGERLVRTEQSLLETLDLPADLETALKEIRGFTSFHARRRQMQFIGRLMRDLEPETVRRITTALEGRA